MNIHKICIVTNKYPNKYDKNVLVFVQQLVWEFARLGIECVVICPMPINRSIKYLSLPFKTLEKVDTGESVTVLRPKYISLGQTKFFGINPARISTKLFEKCVFKTIKKEQLKPNVIYSHFITPAGIASSRVGRSLDIPTFMAHGEATTMTIEDFGGAKRVEKELKTLQGIIAVSAHNKKMLVDLGIASDDKIGIFPNGYNPNRFRPLDKKECRLKFGFCEDDFIVGFVGSFDERKGIERLEKAIEKLNGAKFACAGKGKIVPSSSNCVWSKPVNNKDLVYFYNACDIFVLPTRMEGCCNAIVEAIACGLPIVSSDRLFNYDILDRTNSILIDPDDVDGISSAIQILMEDTELRKRLSDGSIKKSASLTINYRAKRIINFMENNHEK